MIYVVDSIMGSGKTSAMINFINNSDDKKKFIYITPYLTEVDRIMTKCKTKRFFQPKQTTNTSGNKKASETKAIYASKINGLKRLLNKGYNIVTTHALFYHFDDEIIAKCREMNYTLVMDEVADVVRLYDEITKDDVDNLLVRYVKVNDDQSLSWNNELFKDYTGRFYKEKMLCDSGVLSIYSDSIIMWMFPMKIFEAFKDIYILTYKFSAQIQKYYYDYHGVSFTNLYVKGDNIDNYSFTTEKVESKPLYNYKELIEILDNEKMNSIGDKESALSKTWYENATKTDYKKISNNTFNFFHNIAKAKSEQCLWTTYKEFKDKVKGRGFTNGFIPCNMRASNEFSDRHYMAYLINFYANPLVTNFFRTRKIEVNREEYALSDMIQLIWRSAIRNGEKIYLYMPSKRMRRILNNWLDEIERDYNE